MHWPLHNLTEPHCCEVQVRSGGVEAQAYSYRLCLTSMPHVPHDNGGCPSLKLHSRLQARGQLSWLMSESESDSLPEHPVTNPIASSCPSLFCGLLLPRWQVSVEWTGGCCCPDSAVVCKGHSHWALCRSVVKSLASGRSWQFLVEALSGRGLQLLLVWPRFTGVASWGPCRVSRWLSTGLGTQISLSPTKGALSPQPPCSAQPWLFTFDHTGWWSTGKSSLSQTCPQWPRPPPSSAWDTSLPHVTAHLQDKSWVPWLISSASLIRESKLSCQLPES